jgi:aubergine-like protein
LKKLKLKLIGRNYFDPSRAIQISQHQVQLWPGFLTGTKARLLPFTKPAAINPTEAGIMLLADITHKVLRTGRLVFGAILTPQIQFWTF